jgi:hypothetical protein
VKDAFREFEANHELDIDLNERDLIKLADKILGEEKVISVIELELILGLREWINKAILEGMKKI